MKKTLIIAVIAALALLTACQNDDFSIGSDNLVFTATIADATTRTTVNTNASDETVRGKIEWVAGDEITIRDASSHSAIYIAESAGQTTKFSKKDGQPNLGSGPYTATYGSAPSVAQNYSDYYSGAAQAKNVYMTASATSNTILTFKAACGLLKLNLTAASSETDKTISKIKVTGTPTGGSKTTFILTCSAEYGESIETAKDFYLVLPAGSYNKILFFNKSGKVCQKARDTGLSISNNLIQPITLDNLVMSGDGQATEVTAIIDAGESKGKVLWKTNDIIYVNGAQYKTDANDVSSASFSFIDSNEDPAIAPYNAYYGLSMNGESPLLPSTQTYDSEGTGNMPMYAAGNNATLTFKNLCAVLSVKVDATDMATVKSIKVESDKPMCGAFTIVSDAAVPTGANSVVLDCGTGVATSAEGTVFNIAVPAQAYSYLKIFLSSDGTNYNECMATIKPDVPGTYSRGAVYNIDYKANALRLWTGGPLFATFNVGSTVTDYASYTTTPVVYSNLGGYYPWGKTNNIFGHESSIQWDDSGKQADLSNETDAATYNWGGAWRMPTKGELCSLINKANTHDNTKDAATLNPLLTDWQWCDGTTNQYKTGCTIVGYKVSGLGNSIFVPASGHYHDGSYADIGTSGFYYCSNYWGTEQAFYLSISASNKSVGRSFRARARSVRAVLK